MNALCNLAISGGRIRTSAVMVQNNDSTPSISGVDEGIFVLGFCSCFDLY
jgi:hypothetical protein